MKKSLLLILFFLFSCATRHIGEGDHGNLTHGRVKQGITRGQTTQAQVVQVFGSPNIVTKNKSGEEVWTYSRQSTRNESGSRGFFFLFGASGKAVSEQSMKTFDLIVTFDKNDIVKDYSVVTSQF